MGRNVKRREGRLSLLQFRCKFRHMTCETKYFRLPKYIIKIPSARQRAGYWIFAPRS